MKKLLLKIFGGKIRLISLQESTEKEILRDMMKIPLIYDYLELQKIAGYRLYGQTKNEKYLGWVELSEHILRNFEKLKVDSQKEEPPQSSGYEGTV